MNPLYENMVLDAHRLERVRDYLAETNFHLPGATHHDFIIGDTAAYLGFMFLSEDLEAFAVPLTCTAGEHAGRRTFIRMSHDQLEGKPNPKKLPVNEPVRGSDVLTTNRWRATGPDETKTGIDSYELDPGDVPGFDMDMRMLELTLDEVEDHHNQNLGRDPNTYGDISVNWGTLMAGRYPRLLHYRSIGKLTPDQEERLARFEADCKQKAHIFQALGLASPQQIAAPSHRR